LFLSKRIPSAASRLGESFLERGQTKTPSFSLREKWGYGIGYLWRCNSSRKERNAKASSFEKVAVRHTRRSCHAHSSPESATSKEQRVQNSDCGGVSPFQCLHSPVLPPSPSRLQTAMHIGDSKREVATPSISKAYYTSKVG